MLILSVILAPTSTVSETLNVAPATGMISVIFGARLSRMMNVCVSVSLRFPDVSFAMILKV